MTATLYPSRRADRVHPRPSGHGSLRVPCSDDTAGVNYRVRRAIASIVAVAVLALGVVAVSAMVGVLADVGGRPAAASDVVAGSSADASVRVHVAQPGDTLWSIAAQYRGDVGQARFVDALVDLNDGAGIQIGQAVRLP